MGDEAAAASTVAAPATTASSAPPHLLLICFPGQGHVNPMLRLAKRIAAKGLLVTFSLVSTVGAKLAASTGMSAGGDGVALSLGRVRFEFLDDEDPSPDLDDLMRHLAKEGLPVFAKLLAPRAAFRVG